MSVTEATDEAQTVERLPLLARWETTVAVPTDTNKIESDDTGTYRSDTEDSDT